MKRCTKCGELKPVLDFYGRADLKGCRIQSHCKTCVREKNYAYRAKNPAKYKGYDLKRSFGISVEDYNRMFEMQRGVCACCGVHQSEVRITFSVDHCHQTGRIRGLLCHHCNVGIGQFKEDVKRMEAAIAYLRRNTNPELAGSKTNVIHLVNQERG